MEYKLDKVARENGDDTERWLGQQMEGLLKYTGHKNVLE